MLLMWDSGAAGWCWTLPIHTAATSLLWVVDGHWLVSYLLVETMCAAALLMQLAPLGLNPNRTAPLRAVESAAGAVGAGASEAWRVRLLAAVNQRTTDVWVTLIPYLARGTQMWTLTGSLLSSPGRCCAECVEEGWGETGR